MGGRPPFATTAEVLAALRDAETPVLFTTDLADELGYDGADNIRPRLKTLESEGYIASKTAASKATVWWLNERGYRYLDEHDDSQRA